MLTYIKTIFIISYVLTASFVIYSLTMLCLYNEVFKLFQFKQQKGQILAVEKLKENSIKVNYEYKVNHNLFSDSIRVFDKLYDEHIKGKNIVVYYNSKFPQINYIKNIKLVGTYYIGFAFFFLMFILLILLDRFADKEKWIERYKRMYENP